MYLYQKLRMPADHVHADAEELEHFITPELEAQLEYELNYPTTDPHNKPIPR
jgi:Mn-dependent DtxR family transcriptional regulator